MVLAGDLEEGLGQRGRFGEAERQRVFLAQIGTVGSFKCREQPFFSLSLVAMTLCEPLLSPHRPTNRLSNSFLQEHDRGLCSRTPLALNQKRARHWLMCCRPPAAGRVLETRPLLDSNSRAAWGARYFPSRTQRPPYFRSFLPTHLLFFFTLVSSRLLQQW